MKKVLSQRTKSSMLLLFPSFLLMVLVLWGLSFFIVKDICTDKIIETMESTLKQGHSVFSEKVSAFEKMSLRFLMQSEVVKYMHTDSPVTDGKSFQLLKQVKASFERENAVDNLSGISIAYFGRPDTYVGLYGATTRSRYYYDYYMKYSTIDYSQWLSRIEDQKSTIEFWPSEKVEVKGKTERYISLIYKMTDYSYTSESYSVLCNLIPEEEIRNDYQGLLDIQTGSVFLTDKQNHIVFYSGSDQDYKIQKELLETFAEGEENVSTVKVAGKRVILLRRRGHDDFNSFASVDYAVISQQIRPLNRMFLIAFILTFGIGVIVIVRSIILYSRPIKKISRLLHDYYGNTDKSHYNLNAIHTSLDRIIHINQRTVAQLDQSQGFMKDVFIKHLFQSEFNGSTELLKMAAHANIHLPVGEYFVTIFQFESTNRDHEADSESVLQIIHLALKDNIMDHKPVPIFVYDEGIHSIAALYQLPPGKDLKSFAAQSFEDVSTINIDGADISLSIGVSNAFDNLLDVELAKREASFVLDGSRNARHICYYGDMQQYKSFYYPYEREKALISMIHKGNRDEAVNILKDLYAQNYIINPISEIMKQQFLYSVCNTILHLIDEQSSDDAVELYKMHFDLLSLRPPMDMSEQLRLLTQVIDTLCGMQKKNIPEGPDYLDEIITYIRENCTKHDFSLQNVADVFHLSSAYVSRQIHQRTKQTFSSLVEQCRMELAKNYILTTDEAMNVIADKCGYVNSNTFFKAFKRFYSVSPSVMRHSASGMGSGSK